MQDISKSNESTNLINWIEESISKRHMKYYEYQYFSNIEEIGSGGFGRVYRANWKNTEQYFALKSFFNLDNVAIKELAHELELHRDVDFHNNVIRFYGITNQDEKTKKYLLVMEYADSGSLREYLKNNFNNLTWDNKYKFAYQLASAVLCLHNEGIVHRDLHSSNVLVHQDTIKLADFGLSKRIETSSKKESDFFGIIPYIDPKKFIISKDQTTYSLNKKSDVYSIGVLFWEISSGKPPFYDSDYDVSLALQISQGVRETIVPNTPTNYSKLYIECWDAEPDNRPSMIDIVERLKKNYSQTNESFLNAYHMYDRIASEYIESNIIRTSSHGDLSKLIQNFDNMATKDLEDIPTSSKIINVDSLSKEKLVNEIVELILINEKIQGTRNQFIFDNLNNHGITSQEIYNWLLNNQNNTDFIFLLGYFYCFGIGTKENKKKAFNLFNIASEKGHLLAQYYVGLLYESGGENVRNEKLAFEWFKKLADKNYELAQLKVGDFYYKGMGIKKSLREAFDWYKKAANNENPIAMYKLGLMYKNGEGIDKSIDQAIYWCKKSVEKGNQHAQKKLEKLKSKSRKKSLSCKIY